jgi:quinoprotein glucose dehydrogenase
MGLNHTGTENFGGLLATAGNLLFASGTKDKKIYAYNSITGDQLWSHTLPHNGSAPPMTFMHKGVQYLVVPATGGGTRVLPRFDGHIREGSR